MSPSHTPEAKKRTRVSEIVILPRLWGSGQGFVNLQLKNAGPTQQKGLFPLSGKKRAILPLTPRLHCARTQVRVSA